MKEEGCVIRLMKAGTVACNKEYISGIFIFILIFKRIIRPKCFCITDIISALIILLILNRCYLFPQVFIFLLAAACVMCSLKRELAE